MRAVKGDFIVTGPEVEPMKFKSRPEARDWCKTHHPGSPVTEIKTWRQARTQETRAIAPLSVKHCVKPPISGSFEGLIPAAYPTDLSRFSGLRRRLAVLFSAQRQSKFRNEIKGRRSWSEGKTGRTRHPLYNGPTLEPWP